MQCASASFKNRSKVVGFIMLMLIVSESSETTASGINMHIISATLQNGEIHGRGRTSLLKYEI